MATSEEYAQWIVKNASKRGTKEFETVAAAYADSRARSASPAEPKQDPSQGGGNLKILNPFGSDFDTGIGMSESVTRGLAGAGKAFADTGRGFGQYLGLTSRDDVQASRDRDAPLMATTAGTVGNFGGNMAIALPALAIPGAASFGGAAAIGAGQGVIQPSTSGKETLMNAGIGGAAGAGGVALARGAKGLYQGGKALIEPFSAKGRERIAGRMIERFADDPARIAATTAAPTVTGALPTLAEQTGDAGIARLQDSLRSIDPQIGSRIANRLSDNNAARVAATQGLAGTEAGRSAAEAARQAATAPQYAAAYAKEIEVSPQLKALLDRPSVKLATSRAANIAKEEGRTFGLSSATPGTPGQQFLDSSGNVLFTTGTSATPGKITGQTLQDLKMGMDALLKDPTSGIAGKEAFNVKATRAALVREMESAIPEFNAARTQYANLSRPLNAMDIGEHIGRKALSNTSNLAGDPRMQANALLGMLRDEEKLIKLGTGRSGMGSRLEKILDPQQIAMVRAVASETDRAAAAATAGNGPGSATAQRMSSQNILRQMIGPTGLPASWGESVLANTAIGKPFNLIYGGVAEPKIQQLLAQSVLDPETAKKVLAAAQQSNPAQRNALMRFLEESARVAPSTATISGSNNN